MHRNVNGFFKHSDPLSNSGDISIDSFSVSNPTKRTMSLRDQNIEQLSAIVHDTLIVGGGINGANLCIDGGTAL